MSKLVVSLSVGTLPLNAQVEEIFKAVKSADLECAVVLAGHSLLDMAGSYEAQKTASAYPGKVFLALANQGTWSAGYLEGMKAALRLNADWVVSMDADGSHDPQDLPRFVESLKNHKVVMSSRFIQGAKNKYPLQRRLISFFGTLLTRTLLTSYRLTDFTSGFEGFDARVLHDVFAKYPPSQWVSVNVGPYHLQNTELRLATIDAGYDIFEIPIAYGIRRKGKTFSIKFLSEVLAGFISLVKNRSKMKKLLAPRKQEALAL